MVELGQVVWLGGDFEMQGDSCDGVSGLVRSGGCGGGAGGLGRRAGWAW